MECLNSTTPSNLWTSLSRELLLAFVTLQSKVGTAAEHSLAQSQSRFSKKETTSKRPTHVGRFLFSHPFLLRTAAFIPLRLKIRIYQPLDWCKKGTDRRI